MVRNREEAARAAENTHTNIPGRCQEVTRGYFDAPSAGDYDGDGAADAEDGWKREPEEAKHVGNRNPPRGTPVSFLGGRLDNGHRAISLGNRVIRSTDFDGLTKRYRAGVVGNGTLEEVERAMGVTYAGWSDTIDGYPIPLPTPPMSDSPGPAVEAAIKDVKHADKHVENAGAVEGSRREKKLDRADSLLDRAKKILKSIPNIRKKR